MNGGPDMFSKLLEFVKAVGIPGAALFWLLYWLPQMDRQLTQIVLLLQQHITK